MKPITRILTGIKPTGIPHLGNLFGAILPAIESSRTMDAESFLFVADYHALVSTWDAKILEKNTREIAATWLAFGLDTRNVTFYRQSDVPEIMELAWILSCLAPKGLLNRAHAFKAAQAANLAKGKEDVDAGVCMGLYCYPVLMAADIIAFGAKYVPVGKDQVQHIEIARDLAHRFNSVFGQKLVLPEPLVQEETGLIPGLDGRKMSKSYGNTIPVFESQARLRKLINGVKTDSRAPDEPKDPEGSMLFQIYRAFSSSEKVEEMRRRYNEGIMWGEVKKIVFEELDVFLTAPRERFEYYLNHPREIDALFELGAVRARSIARDTLNAARELVGIRGAVSK